MKYLKNDALSFHYTGTVLPSVMNFCHLAREYPFIFEPFKGANKQAEALLSSAGFLLYPTVKKTTLFYDRMTDCFFKILHPLGLKNRILFLLTRRDRAVCNLSKHLLSNGIKVPEVRAYGVLRKFRIPFYVAKRIEGSSLYDILIRERKTLPVELYLKVIDAVARLHALGFWLGDAHLSHILVNDSDVSGFIDIDSIRKNRPFSFRNLAKDLAGLNHPELPVTDNEKMTLLNHYMNRSGIKEEKKFLQLLKSYTEQRWKG